jgi:predicted transcriptional regulator
MRPASLKELAELSGRKQSNLSRTLHTMERYHLVKQEKARLVSGKRRASELDLISPQRRGRWNHGLDSGRAQAVVRQSGRRV